MFRMFASMDTAISLVASPEKPNPNNQILYMLPAIPKTDKNTPLKNSVTQPNEPLSIWKTCLPEQSNYSLIHSMINECFELDSPLTLKLEETKNCTHFDLRCFLFQAWLLSYRRTITPECEVVGRSLISMLRTEAGRRNILFLITSSSSSHMGYNYARARTITTSASCLWTGMPGAADTDIWHARILIHLMQTSGPEALGDEADRWCRFLFDIGVIAFSHHSIKRSLGSKITASDLWTAFQIFLKDQMLGQIANHCMQPQSVFNELLRARGWEQKRVASGSKLWIDVELKPAIKDNYVIVQ